MPEIKEKTVCSSKQTNEVFNKKIKSVINYGRKIEIVIHDENCLDRFIRNK
ncbi:MAG: hypothetical protein JW894_16490 [Bacteroidales bacterium]|nr:hypothetical protein [Bacteroidales bacterium]